MPLLLHVKKFRKGLSEDESAFIYLGECNFLCSVMEVVILLSSGVGLLLYFKIQEHVRQTGQKLEDS